MPTTEAVAAPPSVIEVRNPATGDLLGTVPIHSVDEVRAAIARARAAQPAWAALPVKERCARLLAFRDVGCETCHGPGRRHSEKPLEKGLVRRGSSTLCIECHDGRGARPLGGGLEKAYEGIRH